MTWGNKTKISFDVANNIHCFGSGYFGSRIRLSTQPDVPGSINSLFWVYNTLPTCTDGNPCPIGYVNPSKKRLMFTSLPVEEIRLTS